MPVKTRCSNNFRQPRVAGHGQFLLASLLLRSHTHHRLDLPVATVGTHCPRTRTPLPAVQRSLPCRKPPAAQPPVQAFGRVPISKI
jgi:hypothetical protein